MIVGACAIEVERTTHQRSSRGDRAAENPDPRFEGRVLMNIHGGAYIYCEGGIMEAAVIANAGATVVAVDHRFVPTIPSSKSRGQRRQVPRPARQSCARADRDLRHLCRRHLHADLLPFLHPPARSAASGALGALTPQRRPFEFAGDSYYAFDGLDSALSGTRPADGVGPAFIFANGHDIADPLISPIFGDYAGFPPTYFLSGTRDMLLSSTVLLHRRLHNAGVKTELHVFEAMPHGFSVQPQLPEAQESIHDRCASTPEFAKDKAAPWPPGMKIKQNST